MSDSSQVTSESLKYQNLEKYDELLNFGYFFSTSDP